MRAFVESRPWFLAIRSGDAAGPYLGDYRRSFVRVDPADGIPAVDDQPLAGRRFGRVEGEQRYPMASPV